MILAKKGLKKLILLLLFLGMPNLTLAMSLKNGVLVKTSDSAAIYQIQNNDRRLLFPSEAVFKSYYPDFSQVQLISSVELKQYVLTGNIVAKRNSLVKFDTSPKVYQVKDQNELEWIKSETGFGNLGYNFSQIITLPEILFSDYKIRTEVGPYDEVTREITDKFIDQTKAKKIIGAVYSAKGLVEALGDEYSVLWSKDDYEKFITGFTNDSFEGIGAQLDIKDGQLVVVAPLKGSPAEVAGLRALDIIKSVNDVDVTDADLNQVIMMIRGPKDTTVVLKVKRDNQDNLITIPIVRDTIVVRQFIWNKEKTASGNGVVYLNFSQFSQAAWKEFYDAKQEIIDFKPKGMILDLRNNPGGYLSLAVDLASKWLKTDQIVMIEKKSETLKINYSANPNNDFAGIPLVILVNNGSASASEIVSGALQDYGVAELVGEKTFGKGVVQEVIPLSDGSVVKLTVSEWFTPQNRQINHIGIMPNLTVVDNDNDSNDLQLQAGLVELEKLIKLNP